MAVTPDELRAWAVEVMKIPELSKTSDLSFICRGQMNEIWRYMIDNVKDLETAAAVHQNLQINNANKGSVVRQKFQMVSAKVTEQKAKIQELEKEIAEQRSRLSTARTSERQLCIEVRDSRVKTELMHRHSSRVKDDVTLLNTYAEMLTKIINSHTNAAKGGVPQTLLGHSSVARSDCLQTLRQLQADTRALITKLLQAEITREDLLAEKGRLKQSLGALLKANGAATLISYIAHEAKLSCTRLCVATEAIDRISEARNLRYNVTSVGLVDEVTEPPLTDSVQQILEKRQIEHQKRFYETEQFLSSVRLSNNNEQKLRDRLRQKMAIPLANQEKKAVLIRDIIEKDCQVKELIAALEVLQRITGELQTEVKNSTKQHARLKDKQALIASFQSDRQAKQTQICVLMKQNTDAQRKLTDRQRHLLKAISKMASNTEPSASLSSTRIVENMQTEKDELASLSLLSLTKNPHCISASLQCQGKAGPHVAKLKSYLQYLQYKRPEFLVQAALDMKAGVLNGYLVPPKSEIHNEMREATSQLETVVESASVQNEEHTRITVNKLCAGIGETEEGLKKCDQVNVLIDEWWHQPGLKLQLPSK